MKRRRIVVKMMPRLLAGAQKRNHQTVLPELKNKLENYYGLLRSWHREFFSVGKVVKGKRFSVVEEITKKTAEAY